MRVEPLGLLEQALMLVPDAIVGIREDGTIALANAHTEALFGYAREELVGEPVELLVSERFRRYHLSRHAGCLELVRDRRVRPRLDVCGRRRDGSEFPAEVSLVPAETEDGVLALAAIRDVGGRLASERVGELAGRLAHDFTNILGVIVTCAELVDEEIGEESPAHEELEEIRRAARRAAALARQLLIIDGRNACRSRTLDVNAVLADVGGLLRRAIGRRVALEATTTPGLWPIAIDTGQLEQVLVNLAVNARDAMPNGGRLAIATANVELDAAAAAAAAPLRGHLPAGRYVRFEVRDHGVGMDDETLRRACEPFFTTRARNGGTGLGLATVYGIVTEAGGAIRLDSRLGAGTTVTVHLPACDQSAAVRRSGSARRP